MVPHGYLSDNEGDVEVVITKTEKEEKKPRIILQTLNSTIAGPLFMITGIVDSQISDSFGMLFLDESIVCNYDPFYSESPLPKIETKIVEKAIPTPKKIGFPEEFVEDLWNVKLLFKILIF